MIYKFNNGGIVKLQNAGSIPQSQNNIMKLWHKAYDSKLGEAVRNFMFGKDYNLSNEEYIQKHGFARPNELAMPWFTQVSGPGIIMNLNKLGKVNITLEPEKYWYVAHQTASKNLPSIMKDGLKTGSGLSGTAIPLSEDFLKSFTEGTLKQQHLLHKGSDALVVAKFPKSKFPSGDLDDISIRLMDLGESNNFEVPVQYLKGFIKDQFKQGGILKAQRGLGKVVRKMPNLLLEEVGAGKKAASKFFEHPVVKQSYEHNKDIAKRLGITLQDRPENIAEIVDSPIGINFVPYNNNGEVGAIHHSGIDDPNQLLSIAWTPMTESQAERIGFHEMLHRGYYSAPIKYVNTNFDYYNNVYQPTYKYWHWKTSKLLKPGTMDSYLGDVHSGEAGTNLAEVGKIAGVKMGEKWPGDEKFLETLDKWPEDKKFMLDYLNTDTRAGRRHIWDAMAAKYFTIGTAAAFSNWLNNSNDKETKKPTL